MDTSSAKYYTLVQASFALLAVISIALLLRMLYKGIYATGWETHKKRKVWVGTLAGLSAWTVIISIASLTGITANFEPFPPPFTLILPIPLITILIITFSGKLKTIVAHVPQAHLTYLQMFRVPVEILLWGLFIDNLLPIQMTFEGRNLDILTGLTAPLAVWLFRKNKVMMVFWNLAGMGLLINIVSIAVLSLPTPLRIFMNHPANRIVAEFPIIFLPGLLVPLAYTLHFFSLRKLLAK